MLWYIYGCMVLVCVYSFMVFYHFFAIVDATESKRVNSLLFTQLIHNVMIDDTETIMERHDTTERLS